MSVRDVLEERFSDRGKDKKIFLIHKGVLRLTGVVLLSSYRQFIKKRKKPPEFLPRANVFEKDQLSSSSTSLAMTSKKLLSEPSAAVYLCILTRPKTWTAAPFWIWSRFLMDSPSHATMRNQVVSMTGVPSRSL